MASTGPTDSDGRQDDFDANATLSSLFTPPGIEQAEGASPIIDNDTSTGKAEEVTMGQTINTDPTTVNRRILKRIP